MAKRLLVVTVLLGLLVVGTLSSSSFAMALTEPVRIRIATFDPGTAWYAYGATISELLREKLPPGSVVDVLPFAGSMGNAQLVVRGDADLGMTMSVVARWAKDGIVAFREPLPKLRAILGGLDQYYFGPIVRKDFPYQSLEEIRDRRVPLRLITQPRGSLGEFGTALVLEAHGMSYDDIRAWGGRVEHTSTDVVRTEMQDGRADMWIQAITPGHPTITELATTVGVRFLSLSPEAVAYLEERYGMGPAVMPAGTFEGQDYDVEMVGFPTSLYVSTDMPDALAYVITKTIVEARDILAERHASIRNFDPATSWTLAMTGVELHPGAAAYFRDAGLAP